MKQTRRKYTQEFKLEAIELVSHDDVSVAQVERDLGLSQGMLHQWIRKYREEGEQAFRGHGRLKSEEETLRQLRRENELLRQERDILKKALVYFAEERR
jgi:transposase